jgi:predicted ribosome quality control (RQC) complex YloA/Tae2 family protein
MSLNWKEINLILEELSLEGAQIQAVVQAAFDVIIFRIHKKGETKQILISLSSGACRLHETFKPFPKSDKPLRFAQFLNSRIVNGYIHEASQLGDNRIVRLLVKRGENTYKLYIRLWSNAANFIVTDENGERLDAMRRLPNRGETPGGTYQPENPPPSPQGDGAEARVSNKSLRIYEVRELPGDGSFNKKIDDFYASQAGPLSLEALREQAKQTCEGSIGRLSAALEKLREKEASFENADRLKTYGDLILSNMSVIKPGDKWLEVDDNGAVTRIELEPRVRPQDMAAKYYEQYRKAKKGLVEIQEEIAQGERELQEVKEKLDRLLSETNPLVLAKLVKIGGASRPGSTKTKKEKSRPGLTFKRGDWLIIVGRDASENDELLRRHVKGNDLWLHARDYHGSYVFIKQRAGKSVPLDILLDAGNLAIFYSKGRNNGKGDLFYTQVKYLRRAKNGPKGLVIPTQEKNLHVTVEEKRLRTLEECRQHLNS